MTLIEAVKDYCMECPSLSKMASYVDSLLETPSTCSFEEVPQEDPVIEQYMDGSSARQFTFVLAVTFDYSEEVSQNIENCGFFEDFSKWVKEQVDADKLPTLGDGQTATDLEVLTHGYLYGIAQDMQRARYEIRLRLSYDQE